MKPPKFTTIRDVFALRPATFAPLMEYAEQVMRGPGPLSQAQRELIAALTSYRNNCGFCFGSHAAVADELYHSEGFTKRTMRNIALGRGTTTQHMFQLVVDAVCGVKEVPSVVRQHLTEDEIHDAVTVAASFNLFNRLVHAYGIPEASPEANAATAQVLSQGYVAPATAHQIAHATSQVEVVTAAGDARTIVENLLTPDQIRGLAEDYTEGRDWSRSPLVSEDDVDRDRANIPERMTPEQREAALLFPGNRNK